METRIMGGIYLFIGLICFHVPLGMLYFVVEGYKENLEQLLDSKRKGVSK